MVRFGGEDICEPSHRESTFGVRCGVPRARAAILIKLVASESDSSEHERPSMRTRRSHALTDADAADFARTCFVCTPSGRSLHGASVSGPPPETTSCSKQAVDFSSRKEAVGEDNEMDCHRFDPNPFTTVLSDTFEHQTKSLALLPCPDCAPLSLQGRGGRGSRTSHICTACRDGCPKVVASSSPGAIFTPGALFRRVVDELLTRFTMCFTKEATKTTVCSSMLTIFRGPRGGGR
jgi:hypothetical protein